MKKALAVLLVILVCLLAGCDSADYKDAIALYNAGNYDSAMAMFEELGDYEDSGAYALKCKYQLALEAMEAGNYDMALQYFAELGDYEDCAEQTKECNYQIALSLLEKKEYKEAIAMMEALGDYKDCAEKISRAKWDMLYDYVESKGGVSFQIGNNNAQVLYLQANDNGSINITYRGNLSVFMVVFQPECKLTLEYDKEDAEYSLRVVSTLEGNDEENVTAKVDVAKFHPTIKIAEEMEITSFMQSITQPNGTTTFKMQFDDALMIPIVSDAVHKAICENLAPMLEKTELGITPADLGFVNIG